MKIKPFRRHDGVVAGYSFFCPGCGHTHAFFTEGDLRWNFNGDLERPTFSPSLLNTCDPHPDPKQRRCHLFLTDGRLEYCADCAHDLAGQTVKLVDHWDADGGAIA